MALVAASRQHLPLNFAMPTAMAMTMTMLREDWIFCATRLG
jgi:hypothetical protein